MQVELLDFHWEISPVVVAHHYSKNNITLDYANYLLKTIIETGYIIEVFDDVRAIKKLAELNHKKNRDFLFNYLEHLVISSSIEELKFEALYQLGKYFPKRAKPVYKYIFFDMLIETINVHISSYISYLRSFNNKELRANLLSNLNKFFPNPLIDFYLESQDQLEEIGFIWSFRRPFIILRNYEFQRITTDKSIELFSIEKGGCEEVSIRDIIFDEDLFKYGYNLTYEYINSLRTNEYYNKKDHSGHKFWFEKYLIPRRRYKNHYFFFDFPKDQFNLVIKFIDEKYGIDPAELSISLYDIHSNNMRTNSEGILLIESEKLGFVYIIGLYSYELYLTHKEADYQDKLFREKGKMLMS
jgi:hypothetical protein